jgi:hypothetical protein
METKCKCAEDPAWNVPSHTVPICDVFEIGADGNCTHCYHEKACHIDYRAHAEMLARALQLWTDKPPPNSSTQELLAYFAAAHEAGVLALDVYNRRKGDQQ